MISMVQTGEERRQRLFREPEFKRIHIRLSYMTSKNYIVMRHLLWHHGPRWESTASKVPVAPEELSESVRDGCRPARRTTTRG